MNVNSSAKMARKFVLRRISEKTTEQRATNTLRKNMMKRKDLLMREIMGLGNAGTHGTVPVKYSGPRKYRLLPNTRVFDLLMAYDEG